MTPEALDPGPAPMGEISRITGVFFEPSKTFEDIAARPRWFAPMMLIIVSVLGLMTLFTQLVGWEAVAREQMDRNPQTAQMPAEQRQQSIEIAARFGAVFAFAGTVVGVPLSYLVISAILLGVTAGIMSAKIKLKQAFAAVCYGSLPAVISTLLAMIVLYLKGSEFNLQNPLMFNPAAAMDPLSTSKFLYSLLSSLDLFSFWMIFLIATGLKAADPKRMSLSSGLFAVGLPWAIYVLAKSAMAGMFS